MKNNNMKYIQTFLLTLIVIGVVLLFSQSYWVPKLVNYIISKDKVTSETTAKSGYKDLEYKIDGLRVKLVNGLSEMPIATGSATKVVTRYFGNEIKKDLDGDGREDAVFLITQERGGSGTFFYVLGALNKVDKYLPIEAVYLGDRISPQTTESGKGKTVVINYADRKPGESFAVAPSVGKSLILLLDSNNLQFGEVAKDFEGEADVTKMKLNMKTWNWVSAEYNDGRVITPKVQDKFKLTFQNGNRFSATTDCNGVGGEYSVNNNLISFSKMMSTLMYCENSQEAEFSKLLENASSYHFTSKGELIFDLKFDSGVVIFR
jgi:heat shock protein HslJ